ncbi:hypothetical protein ZWY2020_007637 [Hordeum vulgare]|nr:hypothetical protein ZWY2020_007637 [Hordeum vulgare]
MEGRVNNASHDEFHHIHCCLRRMVWISSVSWIHALTNIWRWQKQETFQKFVVENVTYVVTPTKLNQTRGNFVVT